MSAISAAPHQGAEHLASGLTKKLPCREVRVRFGPGMKIDGFISLQMVYQFQTGSVCRPPGQAVHAATMETEAGSAKVFIGVLEGMGTVMLAAHDNRALGQGEHLLLTFYLFWLLLARKTKLIRSLLAA